MKRTFITGANRGLGLEFVRQYLTRGANVFASCRHPQNAPELAQLATQYPDHLQIIELAITDDRSIEQAALATAHLIDALDLLINNAGMLVRGEQLATLEAQTLMESFAVNAVAPIMIVKHFLDLLKKGTDPTILNVSSQLGSITNARRSTLYSYSASKAGLNMFNRILAHELRPLGITSIVIHPGWVQTDMGGSNASLTPNESVRGMIRLLESLKPEDSGEFFQWNGTRLPW